MTDVFRVLSTNGGGIRGIDPAMVLAEIEKPAPSPHALLRASGTTCCASAKKAPAGAALRVPRGVQWLLNMAVG
jgi:hypothetical protein